jgi:putative transposase
LKPAPTLTALFMESNQTLHHRRLTRLKNYDYSQAGGYFITICAKNRLCLFGKIENETMFLNHYGEIVSQAWLDLSQHYANVQLDAYAIMPNHLHGIIFLGDVRAGFKPAPTGSSLRYHALPEIIRAFKTFSSRRINELRKMPKTAVWQRSYYEHVIRRDESLDRIREYIITNPLRWALDRENPANRKSK